MAAHVTGRIILLNGTSSSGKTTLVQALRPRLPASLCYYASDQLAEVSFRPLDPVARTAGREMFFLGFHRSIAAMVSAGLDLLVEHIVEEQTWADELAEVLGGCDVFWIGVHVNQEILAQWERQCGNRAIGEALYHLRTHDFCRYNVEVDTTRPLENVAQEIVAAWESRKFTDAS